MIRLRVNRSTDEDWYTQNFLLFQSIASEGIAMPPGYSEALELFTLYTPSLWVLLAYIRGWWDRGDFFDPIVVLLIGS